MTLVGSTAYTAFMISSLWFLIKSAVFIAAFVWILSLGGAVSIALFGYEIAMSFGVFAVAVVFGFYVLSLIVRAIRAVIFAPKMVSEALEKRAYHNGMRSLTYGLSAVAAGDVKTAQHYTARAVKLLNDDYGLVALLSGLTARLKGDEKSAETAFKSLLTRDETSFLGIRGLLQTALDRGDNRYARVLARQAYDAHPHQGWVIKTLYDLECKYRDFDAARPLLKQATKRDIFSKDQAKNEQAAMMLSDGDVARAYKIAPDFLPAILPTLKIWAAADKRRKCLSVIKKAWDQNPHPDLLDVWVGFAPKKALGDSQKMMEWIDKLWERTPDDTSANVYCAEVALRFDDYAKATAFLKKALSNNPTLQTYQLMARIDRDGGWNETIANARHDKAWTCTKTGEIVLAWQPFNSDGDFNTIEWISVDDINPIRAKTLSNSHPFFLTDLTRAA